MLLVETYKHLLREELRRNLGLWVFDEFSDTDMLAELFRIGYDVLDLEPILKSTKFTDEELAKLSAYSVNFFYKYVPIRLKGSKDFMLAVFNNTEFELLDYFAYITNELKMDKSFLKEAIRQDGFIILDDEFFLPHFIKDKELVDCADKFFCQYDRFNELVSNIVDNYKDANNSINDAINAQIRKEYKNQHISQSEKNDYYEFIKMKKNEKQNLAKRFEFLKSLTAFNKHAKRSSFLKQFLDQDIDSALHIL